MWTLPVPVAIVLSLSLAGRAKDVDVETNNAALVYKPSIASWPTRSNPQLGPDGTSDNSYYHGGGYRITSVLGASVSLRFNGSYIAYYSDLLPGHGNMEIDLDGNKTSITPFTPGPNGTPQVKLFEANLDPNVPNHTITLTNLENKTMGLDYFLYTAASPVITTTTQALPTSLSSDPTASIHDPPFVDADAFHIFVDIDAGVPIVLDYADTLISSAYSRGLNVPLIIERLSIANLVARKNDGHTVVFDGRTCLVSTNDPALVPGGRYILITSTIDCSLALGYYNNLSTVATWADASCSDTRPLVATSRVLVAASTSRILITSPIIISIGLVSRGPPGAVAPNAEPTIIATDPKVHATSSAVHVGVDSDLAVCANV
ncbi:hypothetical protein AURDEDRAFT_160409 [Auricularia subglabra TFB-10046 SS5]|nr:hypothetical protein AURDEDRAFT_160409 [Auricularia subglabra TFB-10046 SS5]